MTKITQDNVRIDNEDISNDPQDPELWGSWTNGPGNSVVRHQEIARQVTADDTTHDLFETSFRAGFVVVAGNEDGDVTEAFLDIVLVMAGVGGTIAESLTRGTPPTRSYGVSGGTTVDISIEGSSETYNVSATGTALLES